MTSLALSDCPYPSQFRNLNPSKLTVGPSSLSLLKFPVNPVSIALKKSSVTRAQTFKCSSLASPSLVDHSAKFKEAAKHGNLIPLYRTIFSDHLTPVVAYRCLVKEDDREAPSFLFESVEPGLKVSSVGRYSVIGAQPSMEVVAKENKVTIMDHQKGTRTESFAEDPMDVPREMMKDWVPQRIDELPEAFCGKIYTQT